jgi:hypothetical protein
MTEGNLFLLSWDMLGLDSVVNITAMEKEATWAALQDQKSRSLGSVVNSVLLRARANSHRHYEVYTVNMEESMSEQDIRTMFDTNPQGMADLIRGRGHKIYSDRYNEGGGAKIV